MQISLNGKKVRGTKKAGPFRKRIKSTSAVPGLVPADMLLPLTEAGGIKSFGSDHNSKQYMALYRELGRNSEGVSSGAFEGVDLMRLIRAARAAKWAFIAGRAPDGAGDYTLISQDREQAATIQFSAKLIAGGS